MRCRSSQKCTEPAGYGNFGTFCIGHAEELDRIRVELANEGRNMSKRGMDPNSRRSKKWGNKFPTCCTIRCDNPRTPPDHFCEECKKNGCVVGEGN